MDGTRDRFSDEEVDQFHREGYLHVSNLAPPDYLDAMRHITEDHLQQVLEPIEYEADLHYPDAPTSRTAEGGMTVRRLLQAHSRGIVFTRWIQWPGVIHRLQQLLGPRVVCPLAHHNCIMTKLPRYSSVTRWHQDIRYWSFPRPDLISVWLALGSETPENGSLYLVPGSHQRSYDKTQFDEALFFRDDHPQNQAILEHGIPITLAPGDVLFFHCRLLHSAGRNNTSEPKYSVVFTYRAEDNPPLPGTRSASLPEMLIHM